MKYFFLFCLAFLLSCSPEDRAAGENHPPEARDDVFSGASGSTLLLDVLKNDSDKDGDKLYLVSTLGAEGQKINIIGDKITYTPKGLNYTGVVEFSYIISDSQHKGEAQVTIYITNTK